MATGRLPLESELVVIGDVSPDFAERMASAGASVSEIAGRQDVRLVALNEWKSADAVRQEVARMAGGHALVEPVLTDESGARLLPTGSLRVRFRAPQNEDGLRRMAQRLRVCFVSRNRWQPTIAEFRVQPNDPRSVVEVADAMARDRAVEDAWPDVLASFKRETTGA